MLFVQFFSIDFYFLILKRLISILLLFTKFTIIGHRSQTNIFQWAKWALWISKTFLIIIIDMHNTAEIIYALGSILYSFFESCSSYKTVHLNSLLIFIFSTLIIWIFNTIFSTKLNSAINLIFLARRWTETLISNTIESNLVESLEWVSLTVFNKWCSTIANLFH